MGTVLGDAGYCPSVGYSGSPDALAYRDATFGQQDLDYPDRYGERQRPVAAGLVKSLSHPEGNVTGVSQQNAELGPKRIELLREVLPGLARVGQRRDINVPTSKLAEAEGRQAAQKLGIAYVPDHVMNRSDLERAFAEMEKNRPGALVPGAGSGLLYGLRQMIIAPFSMYVGSFGPEAPAPLLHALDSPCELGIA